MAAVIRDCNDYKGISHDDIISHDHLLFCCHEPVSAETHETEAEELLKSSVMATLANIRKKNGPASATLCVLSFRVQIAEVLKMDLLFGVFCNNLLKNDQCAAPDWTAPRTVVAA